MLGALAAFAGFVQGISSLIGGSLEAEAAREQAKFQAQQLEFNAKVSDMQAKDAKARGSKEASRHRVDVRRLIGTQRAAYAAGGVDVNSGIAAQVQAETDFFGELDALTIENNAAREAFGYKVQAMDYRNQAKTGIIAANNRANTSLIMGGLGAVSSFAQGAYHYADVRARKG